MNAERIPPTDDHISTIMQAAKRILKQCPSWALAFAIMLGLAALPPVVQGQTFTLLYSFTGGADGGNPAGAVIRDAAGNLYGTARIGGPSGRGTVFKLDRAGKQTVLLSFPGSRANGASPQDGVIRDVAGNLYGTTGFGGDRTCDCGTVFKLDTTGKETVLHKFAGGSDGKTPTGGLIRDANGNLYGTTQFGGDPTCFTVGCGTVFKVDGAGNETVLHSFTAGTDGEDPIAIVVRDPGGNLFGTTLGGGLYDQGAVFKVDSAGNEMVLHSFSGRPDGDQPGGGLIPVGEELYGTTEGGGDSGTGTVYKLDKSGNETVVYSFSGGADAAGPFAGLIHDKAGNFYGTTTIGGSFNFGTVFKLDSAGKETVLHSFTGGSDGSTPLGKLDSGRGGQSLRYYLIRRRF